jgi:hypothetical protein
MNESSAGVSSEFTAFTPPIARYTPSTGIPGEDSVETYIDAISYQHDPVTALQLAWVLQEMPDYQKRFPYFGVPLSEAAQLIDEHEVMQETSVQIVIGIELDEEHVQTIVDAPTIGGEVNVSAFQELVTNTQASTDHLFKDISLFSCQYTDPDEDEPDHNVVYVDDPRNYDFFITFTDDFALDSVSGGKTFHEIDAVEFTDTIGGLLQLKAQMLIDTYSTDEMMNVYVDRFVKPLLSPLAASQKLHGTLPHPEQT